MAITLTFSSDKPNNPFEIGHRKLVAKLAAMTVPAGLPSFPQRDDFEAVADYIRAAAEICDEWLNAIGHQVAVNASCNIDMTQFDGAFTGAVDGNCTHEIETAALTVDSPEEVA